jgi:hypothetical protein
MFRFIDQLTGGLDDIQMLIDQLTGGLEREAQAQSDFYKDRQPD